MMPMLGVALLCTAAFAFGVAVGVWLVGDER